VELLAASAVLWVMLVLRGYRPAASWPLAAALGLLEPPISCSVLVFSWQEFVLIPQPATDTVAATISGWQLAQASSSLVRRSSPAG
jgi:hypothetical protein